MRIVGEMYSKCACAYFTIEFRSGMSIDENLQHICDNLYYWLMVMVIPFYLSIHYRYLGTSQDNDDCF